MSVSENALAARKRELNRSKIPTPDPKPARRRLAAPPDVFSVLCSKCKSAKVLLSQYVSCALLSVLSSTALDILPMIWSNRPVRSSSNDPYTKKPVFVAKGRRERSRQRALLFWWKPEEAPHVREALTAWGRKDLIGRHKGALVGPGPAYAAHKRKGGKGVRYDTHMGLRVERAPKHEESEENWEAIVR